MCREHGAWRGLMIQRSGRATSAAMGTGGSCGGTMNDVDTLGGYALFAFLVAACLIFLMFGVALALAGVREYAEWRDGRKGDDGD